MGILYLCTGELHTCEEAGDKYAKQQNRVHLAVCRWGDLIQVRDAAVNATRDQASTYNIGRLIAEA